MAYRGPTRRQEGDNGYIEAHNDNMVDELKGKVAALKRVTLDIGEEVRTQNRLLGEMDNEFDSGKGLLQSTMRRLGFISKSGGKNLPIYLLFFALFVFFVIYILAKRA